MARKPLIGINLYSVRQFCGTAADLDETLGRIKKIGYPSVQLSSIGPIPPKEVKALLDKHGLVACAAHDSLEDLTQRTDEVIEKLKTVKCDFTALGSPGDEVFVTKRFVELRDSLVAAAKRLAAAGCKLGYHNHSYEFLPFEGTNMFSWLFDTTPSDLLFAEPDTAWMQRGGGSPVAWIHKLAGRIPAIHLKDYVWINGEARLCEVGRGNLDWQGIFTACLKTRIPVWIVEQDDPVAERDIFASIAISLETIQRFLKEKRV